MCLATRCVPRCNGKLFCILITLSHFAKGLAITYDDKAAQIYLNPFIPFALCGAEFLMISLSISENIFPQAL